MLLFENIAIMINIKKITSKVAPVIWYKLGNEEAQLFYTKAARKVGGSYKGKLLDSSKTYIRKGATYTS